MESVITKLHLTLVFQNTEDIFIEYDYLTIRCKKKKRKKETQHRGHKPDLTGTQS